MEIFSPIISGSLTMADSAINAQSGISGSLYGTSSWAENATTASYAASSTSASYAVTAAYAQNAGVTVNTASLLTTASVSLNTITFTKGDGSTFPITVDTGSGGAVSGDYVTTSSFNAFTSSVVTTSSFNGFTQSYNTGSFTGSFVGDGSGLTNIPTQSFNTSSLVTTASFNAFTSSVVSTSSFNNFTSSVVTTSSFNTFTQSYNTGSFTGSFTGVLNGTASQAATASNIIGGKAPHVPYFITDTTLATSSIYQSGSTSVIINQDANTTDNPEALYVWQPHPTSINVVSGKGQVNNYLQLNIQNTSAGDAASSDVVATAANGNETTNYIDMGINGANYAGVIGGPNDGYLYSTGIHLHIGNATPGQYVGFFAGGDDVDANMKLVLDANNQHQITGSLEISGSLNVKNNLTSSGLLTNGTNTVLGNTVMSGSSTIQGTTTMTGSLLITGSTIQVGNNTLLGNTVLSGSIVISGSTAPGNLSASVNIYGDTAMAGFLRFNPYATNIDNSISASYIYVSGSTNDLYFSQNGEGYTNTTRLRWIEGNLYTGLLNGGLITTQSSTVYQVSSGSGIVVNLNASYNTNPYPTVQYVNWPNLSASIAPLTSSYDQQFVSVQADGTIFAQGTPYADGQFNTLIPIGIVVHQNRSTINAVQTFPSVGYGWKQRSSDFIKAFGPLKIAGYTLAQSGSSTGSLVLSGGTAWVDGRNYIVDPNNPSYITEVVGLTTSKIYRYYQSGSAAWKYDTNGGAGYATIDPTQYSLNGTLTALSTNNKWSIQRVYYFPNSATKAFYIYYGNAQYDTKADAIAALTTEPFNEAPNTAANAIFIGYMLLQKTADFTSTSTYEFRAGGLFRGSGTAIGGGSATVTTLASLSDVSITSPANHNLLAYNGSTLKWENVSSITANVTGNLTGTADTASYISPTFISASAAASGFGSGGGVSGDYVTTSSFNQYTSSTTSQFAGTASFATTALNLIGSVTTAATASYSTNFTVASTLTIDQTLTDYANVVATAPATWGLFQQATGSYTSAHGKYTLYNGTNARAGEFMTVWNGTTVNYTDVSTTDIGATTDLTLQASLSGGDIKIDAVAATAGWIIKMLVTYL